MKVAAILLVGLLLYFGVRMLGSEILYDPMVTYFKGEFYNQVIPDFSLAKLFTSHSIRFSLNFVVTLGLIHVLFQNPKFTKLTFLIGIVWWLVFSLLYLLQLVWEFPIGANPAYYCRRFLIHPVLGILLIPALYYQKFMNDKKD